MSHDMLNAIPADTLSAALHSLPDAPSSTEDTLRRVVDLPEGGRAEVTFARLKANRRGHPKPPGSSPWFWTAASAALVE
jgi:hypothetical protein